MGVLCLLRVWMLFHLNGKPWKGVGIFKRPRWLVGLRCQEEGGCNDGANAK